MQLFAVPNGGSWAGTVAACGNVPLAVTIVVSRLKTAKAQAAIDNGYFGFCHYLW